MIKYFHYQLYTGKFNNRYSVIEKTRQEEREKVFDTKKELMYYITKLEKEHIEYVKAKYDKYFKTRSY